MDHISHSQNTLKMFTGDIPAGILAKATALGTALSFAVGGFEINWNPIISAVLTLLGTLIVLAVNNRSKNRGEKQSYTDRVSELTVDEREQLREEARQLRKEEREHMERVVAGYVRGAEIARKRSHILANGMMTFQLAHQKVIQLLLDKDIEIPSDLYLNGAATRILTALEEITEAEPPPVTLL